MLEQEHHTEDLRARANARAARFRQGGDPHSPAGGAFADDEKENENTNKNEKSRPASRGNLTKRDFFGRVIVNDESAPARRGSSDGVDGKGGERKGEKGGTKVWLHYHEGFSNAVRKPITIAELMADL